MTNAKGAEATRLKNNYAEGKKWLKWGPYLSERQWGTVREDYSPLGQAWEYFPHDQARSRSYRWGEDGIAGICDNLCNLCFALSMWNGNDLILKERLFGLTGKEGNHGEDCKELYYYLDNTPTHSYMKYLYKYPHSAYPYEDLVETNRQRSKQEPEYEILDTGVFDDDRYFDVYTEYAKNSEEDILIRITVYNRGAESAKFVLLPTLWFRNRWSFLGTEEKPSIKVVDTGNNTYGIARATHHNLGTYYLYFDQPNRTLVTENETNKARIFSLPNESSFVKDAFHQAVIQDDFTFLEGNTEGTKLSPLYDLLIEGKGKKEVVLRLSKKPVDGHPLQGAFSTIFDERKNEADEFYANIQKNVPNAELKNIQRQAFAGMLWTKQYYNIDMEYWLEGDPGQPPPPEMRKDGRNSDWRTLNNEDIISMPDKWEYPWYAVWDSAFHCIPLALIDPDFAKEQLLLFLWEWYMKPNGQIPAYEWEFGDVNPPVHAWAVKEVYDIDKSRNNGEGDILFLKKGFQKLLLNFTWWVNKKDSDGNNVFEGGFLGLDNIGIFDRSDVVPGGGHLEQADGTSWMAMYCLNMLDIAIEIALVDPAYEDMATKFLEHFIYIAESLNQIEENWPSSWDDHTEFFYDVLVMPEGESIPLKVRSLVGLTTMFGVLVIKKEVLGQLKNFNLRLQWFQKYRRKLNKYKVIDDFDGCDDLLLSLIPKDRLHHLMETLLDEKEFFSPVGIRSLSKVHENPYSIDINGIPFSIQYTPAESNTYMFGGNSNWRGPVWMPMNYLIIQSLRKYHEHYKDQMAKVECPTGSGRWVSLDTVADDIAKKLIGIFTKDEQGHRRVNGENYIYRDNPHFKDLVLFYEYFHGDTGRGVGASHQTGWTGLVAELIHAL